MYTLQTNLCYKFNLGIALVVQQYAVYISTHLIERLGGSDNITNTAGPRTWET